MNQKELHNQKDNKWLLIILLRNELNPYKSHQAINKQGNDTNPSKEEVIINELYSNVFE
jgi:hypothetical protein